MRKNERERLARRAEYLAKNLFIRTVDGDEVSVTKEQVIEARSERLTALHETSHAVAAWMQDMPISHMQFNDRKSDFWDGLDHLLGGIEYGIPVSEMLSKTIGDRVMFARQHAFVALAGVFGVSNESSSDNPILVDLKKRHTSEAVSGFATIADILVEAVDETSRLISVVKYAFNDRRVRAVTQHLAGIFLQRRKLSGVEVTAIIDQAWAECEDGAR
jgi:hypothetical protein